MEVTDALRNAIEAKVDKLRHFLDRVIEINVVLSVEKINHISEMTIITDNGSFFSEVRSDDMYDSIDRLFEKAERQVRKFHERINDKKQITPISQVFEQEYVGPEYENPLSKITEISPKPMTTLEALLQMQLDSREFYIFQIENEDKSISEAVLIRRDEPEYILVARENGTWNEQRLKFIKENLIYESSKETHVNSMSLDEAVSQLRNLNAPYLIFFDHEFQNLNLLYGMKHDKIGMITTDNQYKRGVEDKYVM